MSVVWIPLFRTSSTTVVLWWGVASSSPVPLPDTEMANVGPVPGIFTLFQSGLAMYSTITTLPFATSSISSGSSVMERVLLTLPGSCKWTRIRSNHFTSLSVNAWPKIWKVDLHIRLGDRDLLLKSMSRKFTNFRLIMIFGMSPIYAKLSDVIIRGFKGFLGSRSQPKPELFVNYSLTKRLLSALIFPLCSLTVCLPIVNRS